MPVQFDVLGFAMTIYATLADLIDRFGESELVQRSDRSGSGVLDSAVVDRALEDANAEVDAFVSVRYALPLAHVPVALRRVACDLARGGLYADLSTDEVRARLADARRFLRDVSDGRVSLGVVQADVPSLSLASAQAGSERVFGRSATDGF